MEDKKHDMEAADWAVRIALPRLMSVLPELDGFLEGEVRDLPPVKDRESAAAVAASLTRIGNHLTMLVAECDRRDVYRLDALLQARSAIAMASTAVELSAHLRREADGDQAETVHEAVQGLAALALDLASMTATPRSSRHSTP